MFNEEGLKLLAGLTKETVSVILCAGITSQTMARINYGEAWKAIGVGQSKDLKKNKTETKTECFALCDANHNVFLFLLPDKEGVKALHSNQIANSFLKQVKTIS